MELIVALGGVFGTVFVAVAVLLASALRRFIAATERMMWGTHDQAEIARLRADCRTRVKDLTRPIHKFRPTQPKGQADA